MARSSAKGRRRDARCFGNHDRFIEHVGEVVDYLTGIEAITAEQADEILAAAARSRIGRDDDD